MADPNQPKRNLIMILGAAVLLAATVFIVTGGDLGGRQKVEGDHDLPKVTSPKPSPGDPNTGRR